jgi:hypothetical protein
MDGKILVPNKRLPGLSEPAKPWLEKTSCWRLEEVERDVPYNLSENVSEKSSKISAGSQRIAVSDSSGTEISSCGNSLLFNLKLCWSLP